MDERRAIHREVQATARQVLALLGPTISSADTECSIADRAVGMLRERGLPDTWYYSCPALVLLGSRSTLSISGRHYRPAEEEVGAENLVTVDLSPCLGGVWGDCARSFPIEGGRFTDKPRDGELKSGLEAELSLHELLGQVAEPTLTFSGLYALVTRHLRDKGWENLDKGDNFGHSIATRLEDRRYIVKGTNVPLGEVDYFTFEPHIRLSGGRWGFKHEDIYYFDEKGRAHSL